MEVMCSWRVRFGLKVTLNVKANAEGERKVCIGLGGLQRAAGSVGILGDSD